MFLCDILSAVNGQQKHRHHTWQRCSTSVFTCLWKQEDSCFLPQRVRALRHCFALVAVEKRVWSYQNLFELKAISLVCDQFCLWPRAMQGRWWRAAQWQCLMGADREKQIMFTITGTCLLVEPGYADSHITARVDEQCGTWVVKNLFSFFPSLCIHVWLQKRHNRFFRDCQSYACFPSPKAWKFKISEWLCDLWVPDHCELLPTCFLI